MLWLAKTLPWLALLAIEAVQGQEFASRLNHVPLLGYGTWALRENTSEAVSIAIQTGYRHLDCAKVYGNEKEVGKGIEDGLAKSGIERESIWVTSKLWNEAYAGSLMPVV